jgi:hypothetical protein
MIAKVIYNSSLFTFAQTRDQFNKHRARGSEAGSVFSLGDFVTAAAVPMAIGQRRHEKKHWMLLLAPAGCHIVASF